MASSTQHAPHWSVTFLALLLWAMVEAKPSIPMDFCSGINTASTPANHSIYQSDGLCYQFCLDDFALAIVHDDSCWCSNYVPDRSVQQATSRCSKPCPGFPDDICGGDGLFGYMLLQKLPSGTISTTPNPTSSRSSSTGTDRSATTSDTPVYSTVTAGGVVKTVTVTPSPTVITGAPNVAGVSPTPDSSATSHGLSAGAAAGIAIAVVAAFLIIGGTIAWLWIKRRRARRAADAGPHFSSQRGSSAEMTTTPRTGEVSETRYYMGSDNPPDPLRRRSTLMPVDPRLDFAKGIYNRAENKSHDSVNTIRDDQDYSRRIQEPPRVLRAVNPDSDID